jgi:hypothetical protein
MSADNGVYIHKFRVGYKVVHAQAIENIYWHKGKKKYNYRILHQYFKHGAIFTNLVEAMEYAFKLHHEVGNSEYGICEV